MRKPFALVGRWLLLGVRPILRLLILTVEFAVHHLALTLGRIPVTQGLRFVRVVHQAS